MIESEVDYIPIDCPDCGTSTFGDSKSCTCGRPLPLAFIIPYEAKWRFEPEMNAILAEHTGLRLMGRYYGKSPEDIMQFNHVEYLALSRYRGFSFDFLGDFSKLTILELDFTRIQSLDGVEQVTSLESLHLTECRTLESIDALSQCSYLRALRISLCNKLHCLDAIQHCASLRFFGYEGNFIESIDFVRNLRELKVLVLNTKVKSRDLEPLLRLRPRKLLLKKSSFPAASIRRLESEMSDCEIRLI